MSIPRDFRGRLIRCPTPRAYADPSAPGGVRYENCKRTTCPYCVLLKVLSTMGAICLFAITQAGVVTLLDDSMPDAAGARLLRIGTNAAFRFVLNETGILVPRACVAEKSDGGRVHLHVLTRGEPVPASVFAKGCERAGLGFASLQPAKSEKALSRYVYKTILPGAGQEFLATRDDLDLFNDLNAGRVIHSVGSFWRDTDGTVLRNSAEAIKAATRERRARRLSRGLGSQKGQEDADN